MWLVKAYNLAITDTNAYFSAIEPGEFYEWKYLETIPKGAVFTKRLPPSDIITKGLIAISAKIDPTDLVKQDFGFKLINDVNVSPILEFGQAQNPTEILNKFKELKTTFHASVNNFKTAINNKSFMFNSNGELIYIEKINQDSCKIYNYGSASYLQDKLDTVKQNLEKAAGLKVGRAYELSDYRTFNTCLSYIRNGLPVDSFKLEQIVKIAELSPIKTYTDTWESLFTKVSKSSMNMQKSLDKYMSFRWAKDMLFSKGY